MSVLATAFMPGSAKPAATATQLVASVGQANSYSISLKDTNGNPVTDIDPGDYTITVHDLSSLHDFHLSGPGVDMQTDLEGIGDSTWNVTLVDGVYRFQCDAHPYQMHGTFRVGPPPPAPPKLNGKVGPGKTISLKTASGSAVKSLTAGTYRVAVKDLTKKDNFHLTGPGLSKKTSVKGKSSATWKLTFKVGTYSYRSDARKTLKRKFTVLPRS